MIPKLGDKVPSFEGTLETGEKISNISLLGKKYVLFFYSNDDSSSCTNEACSVRDNYSEIKELGYEIYGVSPNTENKHQKFILKHTIQYSLIADPERRVIEAFHLWGHKKFMGREIMGVYRTTFIIDQNGTITGVIDKVKSKQHGEQILETIAHHEF